MIASSSSRREFLQAAAAASSLGAIPTVHAAGSDTLKVGLIGCGGRGTGAASQALAADPNVKLVAMADAFEDRLESSLDNLKQDEKIGSKIDVTPERRFVGFDAYQKLIASGVDVVLLCTPPHFRPLHLKAAIEAGKHVFAEKPVAVDAPGVRSRAGDLRSWRRRKTCRSSPASACATTTASARRSAASTTARSATIHDAARQRLPERPSGPSRKQPDWTDMT